MAIPSRKAQVETVVSFLDLEKNEGRSLEAIASDIVDGYHDFITKGITKPALPLRPGMLLKDPLSASVRRVQWSDGIRVWLVSENSSYGWLGAFTAPFWEYCEEYQPSKMVETGKIKADGKPEKKRVEMTDREIEDAWSNPDWKPGDKVSQSQRKHHFEVVASSPTSVLLRDDRGGLVADSVKNLEKYYQREYGKADW